MKIPVISENKIFYYTQEFSKLKIPAMDIFIETQMLQERGIFNT